jgi:DNA-binding GntR family transcriptional regulator
MSETSGLDVDTTRIWETRADEAYHRIRSLILDGSIPPNSTVIEAKLVRSLGMSRTPVREALHRMEAEGLLKALPRGGFTVVAMSDEDLANLYQIRAVLEGLAAGTAASKRSRVDIARLEDLYDEMDVAVRERDDDRLITLNREFHRSIARASGNQHLQEMLDDIKGVFERFRSHAVADDARRQQAHEEHGALIEAMKALDSKRARQLAEEHVQRALSRGTQDSSNE